MRLSSALNKQFVRFLEMCLIWAFLSGANGKALDDVSGMIADSIREGTWIGGDSTAGTCSIGTTAYPGGGMVRKDVLLGDIVLRQFKCAVIDENRGYAWFGTHTNPAHVVKVALGDGTHPPRLVSYTTLNNAEGFIVSAVIDKVNGFAYFGTQVSPAYVVKVALGEGDDPPFRVGAARLNSNEYSPFCAVIDVPNGYAYFGTDMNSAQVVKIRLGNGFESPERVDALTLQSGESNLWCGVIDSDKGYAWFGTHTTPARVIKVKLGDGSNPPERIGSVILPDDERLLQCAVINPSSGYALFGAYSNPGYVVKILLGEGDAVPERLGSIALQATESNLSSAVIDLHNGYAYFGSNTEGTSSVVKIDPGIGSALPSRIGSTQLQENEALLYSAVLDESQGNLYFGTNTSPGRIIEVATGNGSELPERVAALVFNTSDGFARCAVIDHVNGYAYIGMFTSPGKIVKVKLSDGVSSSTRVGELILDNGEDNLICAVIDPENGYAYFTTATNPGMVVKVALGNDSELPSRVGTVILADEETSPYCAVIDRNTGYGYFGTNNSPGRVVEILLGNGAVPPVRTGSLVLDEGENYLRGAVIDPSTGYAWFGTNTSPAKVVKVAVGSGNPSVRVGAVQFPTGLNSIQSAVIDPSTMHGYFVSLGNPNRLVKVALGWGWNPPEYTGDMLLQSNEGVCPMEIDEANGAIYIGSRSGILEKVSLGMGDNPPESLGMIRFTSQELLVSCSILDGVNSNLFFGTESDPYVFTRITLSHKNYVKGTSLRMHESGQVDSVSMYSHTAQGQIRLALYTHGLSPQLIWQSPVIENTMNEGWLNARISDGTPSGLFLETGDYWLVWQTNSTASVPSYADGIHDIGIAAQYAWGNFPSAISAENSVFPIFTSDQWSAFIRYEPRLCAQTGCVIHMPSHEFTEGDPCYCSVTLCNAESEALVDTPIFVILDVYDTYYFAPLFEGFCWYRLTLPPGETSFPVLTTFLWPPNAGSASGIRWLAGMSDPAMTQIIGDIGYFTFGWH